MIRSRTDEPRRQPRWLTGAVGLAVVAILLVGGYWLMTEGPGVRLLSPAGSTVAEFTGEGDIATDTFHVRDGWAIRWESTGERFAFAIGGDRDFGTVIDIDEPGSGVTSPTGSGAFRLDVTGEGPWSIVIVQGD